MVSFQTAFEGTNSVGIHFRLQGIMTDPTGSLNIRLLTELHLQWETNRTVYRMVPFSVTLNDS